MSNWYYADAEQQRQGPLSAGEMAQRFHQGRLRLDTLVWRDGLAEWQPLRDFTQELALHQAPAETFYTPVEAVSPAAVASESTAASPRIEPFFSSEPVSTSPYAPPSAVLTSNEAVHGGEVVYAGFWKRYAALVLDGLLMFAVQMVIMLLFVTGAGVGLGSLESGIANGSLGVALIFGVYVVPIALQALYYTWMHASGSQATLGKLAVGIKVTDLGGRRISNGQSLGRWAGYFFFNLFSCGIATLVSAFMAGLSERKQGLHDMAASTLVVDKWAFTAHPERQRRELGTVTVIAIVLSALIFFGYLALIAFAVGMAPRT
ncbi:MAG: RDD family protein [Pseudoxanthomonas sp.]